MWVECQPVPQAGQVSPTAAATLNEDLSILWQPTLLDLSSISHNQENSPNTPSSRQSDRNSLPLTSTSLKVILYKCASMVPQVENNTSLDFALCPKLLTHL